MNNQQMKLLEKLAADRKENAEILEKPSMRGVKTSVVEKYSDQAHFVYELIQNADDAKATKARFILLKDKLVFVHNGSRLFTVSDVDTEETDSKNGKLGDINSITAVANTSKTSVSNAIGKFGVGFKAVFQYTTTPYIYDPNVAFKIERFIIPVLVDGDCSYRTKDETAFVFPFNHPDRDAQQAYNDILHKLKNLVYPTLFLNNLARISYKCDDIEGIYVKEKVEKIVIDNTEAEKLNYKNGASKSLDHMWLFSRTTEEGYKYSCGFLFDENGKLKKTDHYTFCFFPTKKETNLSFIINAPFLLTDSREGIKANDAHNVRMINLLAELAADSFIYIRDIGIKNNVQIIDDNILNYLPVDEDLYTPKNEHDDISFKPFYENILNVFENEKILPSFSDYVRAADAYLGQSTVFSSLFSNEQLAILVNNPNAKWIFTTLGWETIQRTRDVRGDYLSSIVDNLTFTDVRLIDFITHDFIDSQKNNIEWIIKLYSFILETDKRVEKSRTAPVFLDQHNNSAQAFDSHDVEVLFLNDDSNEYKVISPKLMQYKPTQELAARLGIKSPSLRDRINNKILVKENIDPRNDFKNLLDYYIELNENEEDTEQYLSHLRHKKFLFGISSDGLTTDVFDSDSLYFPTEELSNCLYGDEQANFVDINKYQTILSNKQLEYLSEFLHATGVANVLKIVDKKYTAFEVTKLFDDSWPRSTRACSWIDPFIDNEDNIINRIIDNSDIRLSITLWNQLVSIMDNEDFDYSDFMLGRYVYFMNKAKVQYFDGYGKKSLLEKEWIFDSKGNSYSSLQINLQNMDRGYDTQSYGAKKVIAFLEISDEHPEYDAFDLETRQKFEKMDQYEKMGLFNYSVEEINEVLHKLNEKAMPADADEEYTEDETIEDTLSTKEKIIDELSSDVKTDLRRNKKTSDTENEHAIVNKDDFQTDSDDNTKATVDVSKKIEQAKQKWQGELENLAEIQLAQDNAAKTKKYSYLWFRSLLHIEALQNREDDANSREVSISFSTIERERDTARTLILKHADKNIPQVMEQLVDIPLDLTFNDGSSKRLIIEVANVQSYTLRVKVKPDQFLDTCDFEQLTEAKIVTKNPSFLIRELEDGFRKLGEEPYSFDDDYDMQMNLCENIDFIFGPPGTGKTTYLARDVLSPMMVADKMTKVLVLTPTNKAADVLVSKIMQIEEETNYEDWLIRYGVTGDESIEASPVFHGKDLDIDSYGKCCVVTTMARLPYDYFVCDSGEYEYLRDVDWDYIVVDEASMIPLVQMVYMLYLKRPIKFIIAGDPFQIEPTVTVSDWKTENIYKMVNLQEFTENPETVPVRYSVKLLTTQYRSVESIGEVFSQLTYNGVLKHDRSNSDARQLHIENYLDYENLNIIKFPVSKYESIYRPKRLKQSSYQIYSALFVYEFSTYLSTALSNANPTEMFKIGIISPYSAQAGLIDNLLRSMKLPENIEINSGTIHGFQGDECDIIIALFNPPPTISTNTEMFLNKQNIINVAISRARDYLFVLMPDDDTENVSNLFLVNKLKKLIEKDFHAEQNSHDIENLLFDNNKYIEDNAFSTGHQLVNVYSLPEKRYEIRSEDNAVDVQIHGESEYSMFSDKTSFIDN